MSDRLPYFPFYTADHRGDLALRSCSLAARGLWTDMMTLMHEAEPRGFLLLHGEPVDVDELARLISSKTRDVKDALAELERKNVCSRTPAGVIFSRRMVREGKRREGDRERQQRKRDGDRDKARDVTASVTPSVTPIVTPSVTATRVRAIATQRLRDSDQEQEEHRAVNGARYAQPVENPQDEKSPGDQHRQLCALVAAEMDAGHIVADSVDDMDHLKHVAARAHLPYSSTMLRRALDGVLTARGLKAMA